MKIFVVPRETELAALVEHLVRARDVVIAHTTNAEDLDRWQGTFNPGLTTLIIKVREGVEFLRLLRLRRA